MASNNMKDITFSSVTIDEWEKVAESSLKGRSLQSLHKSTYENIVLKPLYCQEDVKEVEQYPGMGDYVRGSSLLGYKQKSWNVSQNIKASNVQLLKEKLTDALKKGQTTLSFELTEENMPNYPQFKEMFQQYIDNTPFALNGTTYQMPLLAMVRMLVEEEKIDSKAVVGWIGLDPLAEIASGVHISDSLENFYENWSEQLKLTKKQFPHLKTILVDTIPYHNGGANAVQELAIALSHGVEHIDRLTNHNWQLKDILEKMIFSFSIGSNFFMEIAKLRAIRKLWAKVVGAYDMPEIDRSMTIAAQTSTFTKAAYDSHVNLLRSGTEAFAAVLGGVQYLHVDSYNAVYGESDQAERWARNTQLILAEEAHLTKTIDPAGGSWYVETLTNELIEKAWELFLKIEKCGGVYNALKDGWLQQEVKDVYDRRDEDVSTRKQTIIGINQFANLAETEIAMKSLLKNKQKVLNAFTKKELENLVTSEWEDKDWTQKDSQQCVTPIVNRRLVEKFEKLRTASLKAKQEKVSEVTIGLISLGDLKEHKARVDFMEGFFAAGGISVKRSKECYTHADVQAFINDTNYTHYCFCGADTQYENELLSLVEETKKMNNDVNLFVAGNMKELKEQLQVAGVRDFIHIKSNCYKTNRILLNEMGVKIDD